MLRDEAGPPKDVNNFAKIKMGVREDAHKGTFALIFRAWLGSLRPVSEPSPLLQKCSDDRGAFDWEQLKNHIARLDNIELRNSL